jgi:hypothetical protein
MNGERMRVVRGVLATKKCGKKRSGVCGLKFDACTKNDFSYALHLLFLDL